jgi:hypothetical protein
MTSSSAYGAMIKCRAVCGWLVRAMAHLALDNLAAHFTGRKPPTPVV